MLLKTIESHDPLEVVVTENIALISCHGSLLGPNLALSLFKSQFNDSNIKSQVMYFGIEFAKLIGLSNYKHFQEHSDWAHARMLLGQSDDDLYFSSQNISEDQQIQLRMFRLTVEQYITKLLEHNWEDYDIFAFTVGGSQLFSSLTLAKYLKEKYPQKLVILGGHMVHGSSGVDVIKKFPFVDVVFLRDADFSFKHFIEKYSLTKNIEQSVDGLDNVVTKCYLKNTMGPYDFDIENVPIPDYNDWLNIAKDFSLEDQHVNAFPIELSRGCYYGAIKACTFCSDPGLSGMSFVKRNTENALKYLEKLKNAYPQVIYWDIIDLAIKEEYIEKVFNQYTPKPFGKVSLQIKPWINRDQFLKLKNFGLDAVTVGIETMSQQASDAMQKGQKIYHNICFLKWCKLFQVRPAWLYMIGIPGEESSWYIESINTVKKIKHLIPPVTFQQVFLSKMNGYYLNQEKYNIKNIRQSHRWLFGFDASQIDPMLEYDCPVNDETEYYKSALREELIDWQQNQRKLFRIENKIIDSRNEYKEIFINNEEVELILLCDSPRKLSDLGQYDKSSIDRLIDLDLLFVNENRVISLVDSEN